MIIRSFKSMFSTTQNRPSPKFKKAPNRFVENKRIADLFWPYLSCLMSDLGEQKLKNKALNKLYAMELGKDAIKRNGRFSNKHNKMCLFFIETTPNSKTKVILAPTNVTV